MNPRRHRFTLVQSDARPDRDQVNPPGTGVLGMWILLASLGMLFFTSLIGYFYIRFSAETWPPPGMPPLPRTLWASTAVLLGCSLSIHRALRAVRRNDGAGLTRLLRITLVLGVLFLGLQIWNYLSLAAGQLTAKTNLYGFTFYMMTGLHAAHVLGGLIPLAVLEGRSRQGKYSSFFHPGVLYTTMYWHFLDAVWIVIFVVLLLGG